MEVGKLYRLKRGNQNQTVGLIVKGVSASVNIYGSQSLPSSLSDMVDCAGQELIEDAWEFSMLPEYIYFTGNADSLEIVGMGFEDLNVTL